MGGSLEMGKISIEQLYVLLLLKDWLSLEEIQVNFLPHLDLLVRC